MTRFHACEKEWKCDEVWVQGRGCIEFTQEQQAKILLNEARREFEKKKTNVGCACTDPASCSGSDCQMFGEVSPIVVYINPAEPVSRKAYADYESSMMAKLDAARKGSCYEEVDSEGKRKRSDSPYPVNLVRLPDSAYS